MSASRRITWAGFAVAVAGVMIGATAFACSGSGVLAPTSTPQPAQGYPGTPVTMSGQGFAERPVEIQWDDGTVLGRTNGPAFSIAVTIPANARSGVHTVTALQDGVSPGRMSFEVLRRPTETGGPAPSPNQPPAGVVSQQASGAAVNPAVEPAPSPVPVTPGAPSVPAAPVNPQAAPVAAVPAPGAAQPTAPVATGEAPAEASPSAVPAARSDLPASSNPAAVVTPSGDVVFGGSLSTPPVDAATASARTALSDVWSGLNTGPRTALGTEPAPAVSSVTSPMTIGVAMLVVGLLVMAVGFGVAEMSRRRRAVAVASHV